MYLKFCEGCFLAYSAAFLGHFLYVTWEVLKREYKIYKEDKRSPK